MANRRLSMRKSKEVLRLRHVSGLGVREIGRSLQVSATTVSNCLERAEAAGLSWPLPEGLGEDDLERRLYPEAERADQPKRPMPSMDYLHRELKRSKGVTLMLLWEEYRREHPEGYSYTQFCEYYARWRKKIDPSLRQSYRAGEKLFVDWAGEKVELLDPEGGPGTEVSLFVATLGASNYTYAEAFADERLESWINGHVHSYQYMGGVAELTIPDNLKTGVKRPCRYEPDLNPTYQEMAEHYQTAVLPARVRRPKDKAKVENAVLFAERWILARLRDQKFFSLGELNEAISRLLSELNERPFQKMEGSRRELFEQLDRPALKPLPDRPYQIAHWGTAGVNIDYHVQIDYHFYSVPHHLVGCRVDTRLTQKSVEILYRNSRVACHQRVYVRGKATTINEHRPKSHQKYLQWTPGRILQWAENEVGEHCARAAAFIINDKPHPEQGYRSCLGLIRLAKGYGPGRVEAACRRALALGVCSYRSIRSILENKLDEQPLPDEAAPAGEPVDHPNLRGRSYYQGQNQ